MNRRTYTKTAAGITVGSGVGLAGCSGGGGDTGTLATRASDQPGAISDFETCVVRVTGIWVKPADGELVKESISEQTVDLTKLQGEKSALLEEVELETGTYEFLQLKVSETDATLKNGNEANVSVPGEAPLKFNAEFEIRANRTTTFIADFTPVKAGPTGKYLLKPVADEVQVIYEGETTTTQ